MSEVAGVLYNMILPVMEIPNSVLPNVDNLKSECVGLGTLTIPIFVAIEYFMGTLKVFLISFSAEVHIEHADAGAFVC